MSGLLQSGAAVDPIIPGALVRPATMGEVWDANRVLARGDRTDAEAERLRREYEPLLAEVNADRAKRGLKPMVNPGWWQNPMMRRPSADNGPLDFASLFDTRVDRDQQERAIFDEIGAIRRRNPGFLKDAPADLATFRKGVIDREKAARAGARDVLGRSSGFTQGAVGFAAGTWETMHDPVNIASLPLGGGGGTIWAQAARSALVNGGLELIQQPIVAGNREDLGEELTLGEAGLNTLMGAAGGVVGDVVVPQLGKAAIKGVGKAVDALTPLDRKIASALARADLDGVSDADIAGMFGRHVPADIRTPDESAAIHVIEREAEIRASSPYVDTPEGMDAHAARMQATMEALVRTNTAEAAPIAAVAPTARPKLRTSGGRLANDVVRFFRDKGYSEAQARGIAAGIAAESASNHGAINPTSGAHGLGQWLGSRKAELIRRYGPNPTRQQQLEFLHWELQGGDHGGRKVLAQADEAGVLRAYINDFMRPAKGAETTGDLSRGMAALGREGEDIGSAMDLGGDTDAPIERPAALDAERVAIDAPEIDYADVPQLRRDAFEDDASWQAAQQELVDNVVTGEALDLPRGVPAGRYDPPAEPIVANWDSRGGGRTDLGYVLRHVGEPGRGGVVGGEPGKNEKFQQVLGDMVLADGRQIILTRHMDRSIDAWFEDPNGDALARWYKVGTAKADRGALEHIVVAPSFRGAGIAQRLVAEAEERLDANPFASADYSDDGARLVNRIREGRIAARAEPAPVVRDAIAADQGDGFPAWSAEALPQLDRFAEPHGEGAKLQAGSLVHDMRAAIEAEAADADMSFRLDDGSEASLTDILADLDEDEAMLSTIKGCL